MENINALLRRAALSYYNGKPMMPDAEFDRLAELCNFEEVGHSGGKIKHYYQLFSLQKVFENEISTNNPFQTYKKPVVVTPKLDGAAVSLLYVEGKLHRALTRGDGKKGIDVTEHLKTRVPHSIHPNSPSVVQITGEVVAPKAIKNSRNYAAGALNLKDTKEFETRELLFIVYGLQPYIKETWTQDMNLLSGWKFWTVLENEWTQYPNDGYVFRIDSNEDFENFGYTAHHPKGAYALKRRQKGVKTTLVDVIWSVGKSGVVAPVAILKPVEIDDAIISRATLHNMRFIDDLNLEIGCEVEVIRSGEIIPRIVRRVD
jgi:NAD-dependent DNA ligase